MEKLSDEELKHAVYYVLASKKLGREFRKEGDEVVAKVISTLSVSEVKELGSYDTALSELQSLAEIGCIQEIRRMAKTWEHSRHIRG